VDEDLVRALVLYKRGRNLYGEAKRSTRSAWATARWADTGCREQYGKAVELRRALGNRRGVATSLRNLANVLSLTGQYDDAEARLKEARAINASLGDRAGLAAVDNELGLLAEERGDYPDALAAFRRALQAWRQPRTRTAPPMRSTTSASRISSWARTTTHRRTGSSGEHLRHARRRHRAHPHAAEPGVARTARGRWRQARTLLDASLARAEQAQMPEEAAVSRRNLAELECCKGHIGAAIDQATRRRQDVRRTRRPPRESDAGLLHVQALLAAERRPRGAPRAGHARRRTQGRVGRTAGPGRSRHRTDRHHTQGRRRRTSHCATRTPRGKIRVQQLELAVLLAQADTGGRSRSPTWMRAPPPRQRGAAPALARTRDARRPRTPAPRRRRGVVYREC
jgi:tetratricopeptide (TPR) repeat protein